MKPLIVFLVALMPVALLAAEPHTVADLKPDDPKDVAVVSNIDALRINATEEGDILTIEFLRRVDDPRNPRTVERLLQHLGRLRHVRKLIARRSASDELLSTIADWSWLEELDISESTSVSQLGFRFLSHLKSLRILNLSRIAHVNDETLKQIGCIRELKRLNLAGTAIRGGGLASLAELHSVVDLDLSDSAIVDSAFSHLRDFQSLERLNLDRTGIGDDGVTQLANLTNLQTLQLGCTKVTAHGVSSLKGLTNLKLLDLSGTGAKEDWVNSLRTIPHIKILGVRACNSDIKDDDPSDVAALAAAGLVIKKNKFGSIMTIRHAVVRNGNISRNAPPSAADTHQWIGHLNGLKNLDTLTLQDCVVDSDLAVFGALTSLSQLRFQGSDVTDNGIAHLATLKNLSSLAIQRTKMTDAGLANFSGMAKLERLDLSGNRGIRGNGLVSLVGLAGLRELDLSETGIRDDVIKNVAAEKNLRSLNLSKTAITNDALVNISTLRNLRELDLSATGVSDEGISKVSGIRSLRLLGVKNTKVTKRGVTQLKKALPELSLIGETR